MGHLVISLRGINKMKQLNILGSLPKTKRKIDDRQSAKSENVVAVARLYGFDYWDGDRKYGYGGYSYDGRWRSVARSLIETYELTDGSKVLDVGCGKGFLVHDLMLEDVEIDAYGVDISDYALMNSPLNIAGRLHKGSADSLLFSDNTFDLVFSLNTIHNLDRERAILALSEIQRVTKGPAFVQVDSYLSEAQKSDFEKWVLTAKFHDFPNGWLEVFAKAGYTGDYDWTIV